MFFGCFFFAATIACGSSRGQGLSSAPELQQRWILNLLCHTELSSQVYFKGERKSVHTNLITVFRKTSDITTGVIYYFA